MKGKSLTVVFIVFTVTFLSCAPDGHPELFSIKQPNEIVLPNEIFEIGISTNNKSITSVDVYLFKNKRVVGKIIAKDVDMQPDGIGIKINWKIPDVSYSDEYRIRAYKSGESKNISTLYTKSEPFTIGINPNKALIEIQSSIKYGDRTMGYGMWASKNTDILTGETPELKYNPELKPAVLKGIIIGKRDEYTAEIIDQIAFGYQVGRAEVEEGTYDWSPFLIYNNTDDDNLDEDKYGKSYILQYVYNKSSGETIAIDDMNDYKFLAGKYYRCTMSLNEENTNSKVIISMDDVVQ